MEGEAQLTQFELEEQNLKNQIGEEEKRVLCLNGCDRPASVCLCDELPPEPFLTSTQIVILHHPHERRHKLATVPVLAKCLQNCEIIVGRRLRLGSSPLLDSLHAASVDDPCRPHQAIYLFPGTDSSPSVELNEWRTLKSDEISNLVLIVFDGTWNHAKEMVSASLPFLSKFASRVSLDYDIGVDGGTIFDSDLTLRKEPFGGCMSTMEAVARSLGVLEPDGVEIEERLISVLRAMVRFQASYLKPMKPRQKLLKKGKDEEWRKKQCFVSLG